jgi:ATP-dependent DNA helicase RecG
MTTLDIETEQLEYKKSTAEVKEATDSIAAILNKHQSGVLYFGVKPNGEVIGQQVSEKTLREVSQAIRNRIEPRISPQISHEAIGTTTCIKVVFSGIDTPYSSSNVYYIRVADEDVKMTRSQLEEFLHERYNREHPWDQRVSDKTADDVDEPTLRNYIERGQKAGRISFEYESTNDALERLRLLNGDKLLNTARLCFCNPPYSLIKMAVFAGSGNDSTILDMKRDDGNLFDAVRAGWQYVLKNTRQRFEFNGDRREEIPEIPTDAVHEAVVNALCHRLWGETMDVSVTVFSDKVEVFSPGAFPEGVRPEDLLSGKRRYSKSRNPLLADTLYKSKDIESFGTGLRRIQTACDEAHIKVQVVTEPWGFTIVFFRPDWEKEFAEGNDPKTQRGRETYVGLSRQAIEIVALLKNQDTARASEIEILIGKSRAQVNRILKTLIEANVVEAIGSGPSTHYRFIK